MRTLRALITSSAALWLFANGCSDNDAGTNDGSGGAAHGGVSGGETGGAAGSAEIGGGGGDQAQGGASGAGVGGNPEPGAAGATALAGTAGAQNRGGGGGAAGQGGIGAGGSIDTAGAGGEVGGEATAGSGGQPLDCGSLGEACCEQNAPECGATLTCLGNASCSCAKKIRANLLLRADGVVLYEGTGAQEPVLDSAGQPLNGFIDITGGTPFGCGLRTNGTVWCWAIDNTAANTYGQLGNGTTGGATSQLRASQVLVASNTPLTHVTSFANAPTGGTTSCAVTAGGNLYCWGDLTWVVNGGTSYLYSGYAQPITKNGVAPLANVLQASVTYGGGCALVQGSSNKEAWCWGCNQTNELAQGNLTTQRYPVKVPGLADPKFLSSSLSSSNGNHANCAIDGQQVRCWGWNPYYSAGGGAEQTVTTPTLIYLPDATTPLEGVVDITAGNETFCALASNETFWCWGWRNGGVQHATNYGLTNVVGIGYPDDPRFLTSDGVYHIGTSSQVARCGAL